MNDLQNLQELLSLMKDQEKMISLMEELQAENEQLTKELQACREEKQVYYPHFIPHVL